MRVVGRWIESVTDERTLRLFQSLKTEMGISRLIDVRLCTSIGTPMMIGLMEPRLLLPKQNFSANELRFIMRHELIHYKRKDLYYKAFVLLATCIHWFNPVVYLMAKAIDAICEVSCDAEVVRRAGAEARLRYSETIISVAQVQLKLKTALSTNFFGGNNYLTREFFPSWIWTRRNPASRLSARFWPLPWDRGLLSRRITHRLNPARRSQTEFARTWTLTTTLTTRPQIPVFGATKKVRKK
jgi:beta-lactamase regulating signal transducer with metallopeptidase domain